jgi:hypothetical protein
MPMIIHKLEGTTKRQIDMAFRPTAVSQGAALFAAYRQGHGKLQKIRVRTVNPHALGLKVFSRKAGKHVNDVLIRSNQPTLTKEKRMYPVAKGATEINLIILQGELEDPRDCVVLGTTIIPNLDPEKLPACVTASARKTACFPSKPKSSPPTVLLPSRSNST